MRAALHDADVSNPFDSKRTITTSEYIGCVSALHDDPGVDLVLIAEEIPRAAGLARKEQNLAALQAYVDSVATKPVVAFSPLTLRDSEYMASMRATLPALPWLRDLGKTFRVVGRLTAPRSAPMAAAASRANMSGRIAAWRKRAASLSTPTALNEAESKRLLADWGLSLVEEIVVADASAAVEAATKIGFPVVIKAVSAAVPHKSDAGLVLLDIKDTTAARAAAETIATRCAALGAPLEGILVARRMIGGVEMVVGVARDPEMGLALMVGMGGVWLELFKDVAFAPPGLGFDRARQAIDGLRAKLLLDGYRGGGVRDVDALARALVTLGQIAVDLSDIIEAIDVNPIMVLDHGCGAFALDGLVVLRPPTAASEGSA